MLTREDLIGAWSLVSYDLRPLNGGDAVYPLGKDAQGRLTYSTDKGMSVFLMARGRQPIIAGDETSKAAAYDSFMAYSGTWDVKGDNVQHNIEFSSVPPWSGTQQERVVVLDGRQLTLSLDVVRADVPWQYRLVWSKNP